MTGLRSLALHGGLLALLLALNFVLPAYHHGNLARVMVLASYAIGYNIMFGYAGLLSLGHAMFFAAGMYGAGLGGRYMALDPVAALAMGLGCAAVLGLVVGLLALRTRGVGFMIVSLMFAQAVYLTILLFGGYTGGDEGFVVQAAQRSLWGIDLSQPGNRYLAALALFTLCLMACLWLVRSAAGRVLVAIRENEDRTALLGYDVFRHKLVAVVISAALSGAAGAVYGILFGYVGASFATVQYSIFPLLWVLLGGAGTVIGPFIGTLFMFYLVDLSSGVTSAYMLIAGVVLLALTLFAPRGIAGAVRRHIWRGLP